MSRSTKLVVLISNLCAIWLIATLVSRGIPAIFIPTVVAFGVSLAAALVFGDLAVTAVLIALYLVPAACVLWFGTFVFSYYAIWLAALCGAMLPRTSGSEWAYPARFAGPLVFW